MAFGILVSTALGRQLWVRGKPRQHRVLGGGLPTCPKTPKLSGGLSILPMPTDSPSACLCLPGNTWNPQHVLTVTWVQGMCLISQSSKRPGVGVTGIRFSDKETEIQAGQVHGVQTVLTTVHSETYVLKWSPAHTCACRQLK